MSTLDSSFHSGRRLQKLRELQGLSILELSQVLLIDSMQLQAWEKSGVPQARIVDCCHYFEVPERVFTQTVHTQIELSQLIEQALFTEINDSLQQRIDDNRASQNPSLDLSNLGLNNIPPEVYGLSWLRQLNLSHNQIKQVAPKQFIELSQLTDIDLSFNQLDLLPATIIFTQLNSIEFKGNPLKFQPNLLGTAMDLAAFENFLNNSVFNFVLVENGVNFGLGRLNDLSMAIEKSQPLLLETVESAPQRLAQYYDQVNSLIYASPKEPTEGVIDKITSVLKKVRRPLIFYSDLLQYRDVYRQMSRQLLTQLPDHHGLIYQVSDQQQLIGLLNLLKNKKQSLRNDRIIFKQLKLTNIGVYQQLIVDLNPCLTVLIGVNGAGKSTILKALALAVLGPDQNQSKDLLRIEGLDDDKTQWQTSGEIQLIAKINGECVSNTITLQYDAATGEVNVSGQRFAQMFDSQQNLRQLVLGIGEQRTTMSSKPFHLKPKSLLPRETDLSSLVRNNEQSCIADFSQWLSHLAFDESQGKREKQAIIDSCFAVFSALMGESIYFAGLTAIEPVELWVEHQEPRQKIPLRLASQGYRAVMGWIGFILQRMYEAYGKALLPLQQAAIILIDEIDQLMHIKWQQKILDVLAKQFFPNTQWIVTTHSPMVINGLDQDEVRQLHESNGQLVIEQSPADLWLWQYGDVVNHLFSVPPARPKVQRKAILAKIEQLKNLPEAERDVDQLELLQHHLARLDASLAYVDEVEKERLRLQKREQELAKLIGQLKSQSRQAKE